MSDNQIFFVFTPVLFVNITNNGNRNLLYFNNLSMQTISLEELARFSGQKFPYNSFRMRLLASSIRLVCMAAR